MQAQLTNAKDEHEEREILPIGGFLPDASNALRLAAHSLRVFAFVDNALVVVKSGPKPYDWDVPRVSADHSLDQLTSFFTNCCAVSLHPPIAIGYILSESTTRREPSLVLAARADLIAPERDSSQIKFLTPNESMQCEYVCRYWHAYRAALDAVCAKPFS